MASASYSEANGVVHGIRSVSGSSLVMPLASIEERPAAAAAGAFGFMIVWNV